MQIQQTGHAIVHLDAFKEAYLVTLPTLTIKGLLSGKPPYPELVGESYITSSTGFTAKIDYSGRSFFGSGQKNTISAQLYQTAKPENVLFEVEGQWNDKLTFYDLRNGKKEIETYDTHTYPTTPLKINPIDQQDPWESRRAWSEVMAAIQANDWKGTDVAKSQVEEAQRELRKREQSKGERWEPALFSTVKEDPVFDALAKAMGYKEDAEKTVGVWKFDLEKAGKGVSPYHGDLKPDLS